MIKSLVDYGKLRKGAKYKSNQYKLFTKEEYVDAAGIKKSKLYPTNDFKSAQYVRIGKGTYNVNRFTDIKENKFINFFKNLF